MTPPATGSAASALFKGFGGHDGHLSVTMATDGNGHGMAWHGMGWAVGPYGAIPLPVRGLSSHLVVLLLLRSKTRSQWIMFGLLLLTIIE